MDPDQLTSVGINCSVNHRFYMIRSHEDGISRSYGCDKEILHRVLSTEQLVLSDKRVRNMYLYLVCNTPHYNIHLNITWSCWGCKGAQWLSGRVLDSRRKGRGFKPHQRHCLVVLEQHTFILALHWFNPGRPFPV